MEGLCGVTWEAYTLLELDQERSVPRETAYGSVGGRITKLADTLEVALAWAITHNIC